MNTDRLKTKLRKGERLRALFLNDVGFQYGAGLANLRQIQSFLLLGHEVRGLCWTQGIEGEIPFAPRNAGLWKGMRQLPQVHPDNGYTDDAIIRTILQEVRTEDPDVIIVGNIHGARWPLELFLSLKSLDTTVVAYMHDCYLISGRCAYPGECGLHETGCDERCPTPNELPTLAPKMIPDAWALRRKIFCGPSGVPIAANSRWTLGMAEKSLKDLHYADLIYLGLDERLFKPIDRRLARRLLGIPEDSFVILGGAVNVNDRRKGADLFMKVASALSEKAYFLVFGHESFGLKGVHATGLLRDYRRMPLLYSAADIYVGTAIEEAFGMTLCEAAACSLPVVAFNVGGVPEVAVHNKNAILVNDIGAEGLRKGIEFFMTDAGARGEFGRAGRAMVEEKFTLKKQGERWMEYLKQLP
jgi:glycosyltransferase involved in cell wall biosynthesis